MAQTAIDLYSGCGGMSAGAAIAIPDLEVKWALDIDANATRTFKKAHPEALVECCDVSLVSASNVIRQAGIEKIDWFFAGPTCQAVSTMGVFHLDDPRNALFVHFIRLLDGFTAAGRKPSRVVMENVPGVVYGRNLVIVRELFKLFEDRGYHVFADVVNMADYGLPQLRNRFILIASVDPIPSTFPKPSHFPDADQNTKSYVTVAEAIGDLATVLPTGTGDVCRVPAVVRSEFHEFVADTDGAVGSHWTNTLAEINRKRIADVPQGGCWKDISPELLPDRFRRVRLTDYATLYGRLHEASPAYTISAGFGNVTSGCFTHPLHDRALTVREGARLQGFKDSFEFTGFRHAQYKQVGNAVPPFFMNKLVRHLVDGTAGIPARITSTALSSGKKLPPMVKRYMQKKNDSSRARDGYGGGTYWPAGWGEPLAADSNPLKDYRLSDLPLRYRRRDEWRVDRDGFKNQDIASVYEDQRASDVPYERVDIPMIREGNLDAIDRAIVRLLAIVSQWRSAYEIEVPVRYLRARLALLHEELQKLGAHKLPPLTLLGNSEIIRLGRPTGFASVATLTFQDGDTVQGSDNTAPYLTLDVVVDAAYTRSANDKTLFIDS